MGFDMRLSLKSLLTRRFAYSAVLTPMVFSLLPHRLPFRFFE